MRVLVLGATGMLGHMAFKVLSESGIHEVWGSLRDEKMRRFFPAQAQSVLLSGVDVLDNDSLVESIVRAKPGIVINCIGLVKQLPNAGDPLAALALNAMLPHRIARLCDLANARLVHISTDCVFSGRRGMYRESEPSDAEDLYGRTKFLGEVSDSVNAVTLRTSMIGHELATSHSLLEWFLSQREPVKGYVNARFSGLPTAELAKVLRDRVLPNPGLHGVYHVAAAPISKFDLLALIASEYGKEVDISAQDHPVMDRSLDAERFRVATGYVAPGWPEMVASMRQTQYS